MCTRKALVFWLATLLNSAVEGDVEPLTSSFDHAELQDSKFHGDAAGDCCRKKSKVVKRIIEETYLWSDITKSMYVLPPGCPLDITKDIFRLQEKQKKKIRSSLWQCDICKKRFRLFVGILLVGKHKDLLLVNSTDPSSASVCLSELCGIYDCERQSMNGVDYNSRVEDEVSSQWRLEGCDPLQTFHEKQHCLTVATHCFPPDASPAAYRLHDKFVDLVCNQVRCTSDGKRRVSMHLGERDAGFRALYYVAFTLTCCLMSVGYCVYFTSYRVSNMSTDLRQSQQKRHGRQISRWFRPSYLKKICCQKKKRD
eukprot:jgi/Bigna1/78748/fgenesh1_pg.56_\